MMVTESFMVAPLRVSTTTPCRGLLFDAFESNCLLMPTATSTSTSTSTSMSMSMSTPSFIPAFAAHLISFPSQWCSSFLSLRHQRSVPALGSFKYHPLLSSEEDKRRFCFPIKRRRQASIHHHNHHHRHQHHFKPEMTASSSPSSPSSSDANSNDTQQRSSSSSPAGANLDTVPNTSSQPQQGQKWFTSAAAAHGSASVPNGHCQFLTQRRRAPFFEGWYLRLVLPDDRGTYAFIFALEAPNKGTVQVVDNDDILHVFELPPTANFHANERGRPWSFSHWGAVDESKPQKTPSRSHSLYGYTTRVDGSHGRIIDDNDNANEIVWGFDYIPSLGWGPRGNGNGRHTGTWIAQFPIFEPGYQVLMGHGQITSGYITIKHNHVNVSGATVYVEKNWGVQFPPKWFWIQCNVFPSHPDLTVVAVGARRTVVVVQETVGLIAIVYNGKMYEFSNWSTVQMDWSVKWGRWNMSAKSRNGFSVNVVGTIPETENGTYLLGPTKEGMRFTVRDAMTATLRISLRDPTGKVVVETESAYAQLEVGGEPWSKEEGDYDGHIDEMGVWTASVKPLPQPLRGIINLFNRPKVETD